MSRVGYWLSEKKIKKLNFQRFSEICKNAGLTLVKIDIDQPLESQGPFDLIVHKLNDVIVLAKQGNPKAKGRQQRILDYLHSHPETIVLDPLANIETLQDRHGQYKFVKDCCQADSEIFIPSFVELTSNDVEENKKMMEMHNIQYPFVCKHTTSQGAVDSHKMCLVFNEEGLRDLEPPCVIQTFINHNAVLYKICMVGNNFSLLTRPSIKNLAAGPGKTIFFDSNNVSKPTSQSFLNQVCEDELELPLRQPDCEKLEEFARAIHRQLGLSLFGIDVIIENHTGRYAVIDINTFPGYDGVPNFFPMLLELLQQKLAEAKPASKSTRAAAENNEGSEEHDRCQGRPCSQECYVHLNNSVNNNLLRICTADTTTSPTFCSHFGGSLVSSADSMYLSKEERVLNELNSLTSSPVTAESQNTMKDDLSAKLISHNCGQ